MITVPSSGRRGHPKVKPVFLAMAAAQIAEQGQQQQQQSQGQSLPSTQGKNPLASE